MAIAIRFAEAFERAGTPTFVKHLSFVPGAATIRRLVALLRRKKNCDARWARSLEAPGGG
ncbi:hypothetical protein [Saccharopolyspora spinosa]|uniref:hypothetical protein n=1 Tax=Saccharopolyspora spinosa TaxID=60894 RepID=UPI0002379BB7|nr:hypothetical protein [Saccharopolyspora spinosa]